jgi:outer membrane protein OmpA-like peptidoglycan-associated protein
VRKYLVSKGIPSSRLVSKGYGATQPIVPNSSDANRQINRRVQFIRTESRIP